LSEIMNEPKTHRAQSKERGCLAFCNNSASVLKDFRRAGDATRMSHDAAKAAVAAVRLSGFSLIP